MAGHRWRNPEQDLIDELIDGAHELAVLQIEEREAWAMVNTVISCPGFITRRADDARSLMDAHIANSERFPSFAQTLVRA